ncbi:MAG TPA: SRPBCC domain-containing protein, partial [Blastocatellia bacterium]|nr:SRPBCC domain-containing protein [Blastocatellia bacterium]
LEMCEVDLRFGGSFRYVWRGPDGVQMGMRGVYREVTPPERIVATEKFDEPWYEGEAVGTLVLTEQLGRTTLSQTVRYESNEIRDAVLRTPMEHGVAYGYDQLEKLLTSTQSGG